MTSRFLYTSADTFVHRLHPNTKLICLLLAFCALMAFNHPLYEAGLLALGVVLLGVARSLDNLRRSWRFLTVLLVFSAALWTLFVRDIKEPHVVWHVEPVLVERGTAPYELVMVLVISGLMALAVTWLALLQVMVEDLARGKGSRSWWGALVCLAVIGILLGWRGHRLLPQMWMWYVLLAVYLALVSAIFLWRMTSPYALAIWLALMFVGAGLYFALQGFLVHVNTEGVAFMWGPTLVLSREALLFGPAMGLRIVAFLVFGLVFASTTSPDELTQGLRRVGLPLTPSVALSLAFRLVPTFTATSRTVMDAQRSRGLELDSGGLLTRLRRTIPVIVPTLAYALRGADDITRALETRGLGAAQQRTEYRELSFGGADITAIVVCVVLCTICIVARLHNIGELLPRL